MELEDDLPSILSEPSLHYGNGGPLATKAYAFTIRVVKVSQMLQYPESYKGPERNPDSTKEFVMSKQLLRSGTAVGALIHEGTYAQSRADFISKMSIALKEANETHFWLSLLKDTGYLTEAGFSSLSGDLREVLRMLIASIKTAKEKNKV